MIDASWIVVRRADFKPVLETFDFELIQFVNLNRYMVFTSLAWLTMLNSLIRVGAV